MTRKITLGILAMLAAFAVLLATGVALVRATLRVAQIASPAAHAAAALAELVFGAAALLAAAYVATRAAVAALATDTPPANLRS